MAALVAGIQYGLSSHSNFHESKSLIFVKLTDSAQRAIEDYLRNRNKINQNPTIQFLGNEGQLIFPSVKSDNGHFTFSLSSNQDIEGPQGGFECVQETGPKHLESLGALPCKMRIQANDDVYETTRHRMHVAEENSKNKCTRVIKASEPLCRKVKLRSTVRTMPPSGHFNTNGITKHRDSPNFSSPTIQPSKLSTSFKATASHSFGNRSIQEKKLTDIMRRPLKERLMHLLALRPFKRPELYDRINREGIREKEKNVITTILKQIAFMRDNTYHLLRRVWNDVQDDWPFYTEQEKTMLKRRKPQNLTPPGSSDGGSSGSGQSPNSTHPGSPPAIAAPSDILGSKRPGYYQGNDGLPTKRQRISHYRKPDSNSLGETRKSSLNNTINVNGTGFEQKQHQRTQRNQQQNQCRQQQQNNSATLKLKLTPSSDNEEGSINNMIVFNKLDTSNELLVDTRTCINMHGNVECSNRNELQNQDEEHHDYIVDERKSINSNEDVHSASSTSLEFNIINAGRCSLIRMTSENQCKDNKNFNEKDKERDTVESTLSSVNVTSAKASSHSGSSRNSLLSFSPASSCNRVSSISSEQFQNTEYPDYLTYYTTISSSEQRTRYKAEFNAYYREYRKLHVQVVKISKYFSQLEEDLREKYDSGNMEGYEAIKRQILQEYAKTKNVNARFYYLHDKLGHIKMLVSEYDAQIHINSASCNNSLMKNSPHFNNENFDRDGKESRRILSQLPTEQPLTCPSKMSNIS